MIHACATVGIGAACLRSLAALLAKHAQHLEAFGEIAGTARLAHEYVALGDERGNVTGKRAALHCRGLAQHVRETRVQRQLRHGATGGGDAALFIQRIQFHQQITRLRERSSRRRIEPGETHCILHAPCRKFERQRYEIGAANFRNRLWNQAALRGLAPQPVANAGRGAAGAAGALLGRGARNTLGYETRQAALRIELRHTRVAAVHHHAYAIDGQTGFGDGRGQHHLAPSRCTAGANGAFLLFPRQIAVQRADVDVAVFESALDIALGAANLPGTGQECQHVALLIGECSQNRLRNHIRQAPFRVACEILHIHWITAAFAGDNRCMVQQTRDRRAVQRGGHDQKLEVIAQPTLAVETQRQRQIGVQVTLVEFVEDHQPHAFECRIVLQATREDAFGQHLDARGLRDFALETDAVTDCLADSFIA